MAGFRQAFPWPFRLGSPAAAPTPPGPHPDRKLVTLLRPNGDVVAVLPAAVRWTRKLTAPDSLDEVRIPWEYLLSDGTAISKAASLERGWYALWNGGKYVVGNVDTDNEDYLSFDALSAEVDDLGNLYTNYSGGPATYLNMTPTAIANALLSGRVGRMVKNPGFGILDEGGLPTNWTHPAGWTSQLVDNRRVWQAAPGSGLTRSDDLPCMRGVDYVVGCTAKSVGAAPGEKAYISLEFRTDGEWGVIGGYLVEFPLDGDEHVVLSAPLRATGDRLRIGIARQGPTTVPFWVDDVRLFEIGPDSGYTYVGELDARDAEIPHTDGAWQKYGVWAEGAGYIEATTPGDYIGRVVNGPFVAVEFAAGGSGASAKVRINGIQYQQGDGLSLVPGTNPISVVAGKALTASGLDPTNDHIVEVEVAATRVRFTRLIVSTVNLISMRWDDKTVYEALYSIAKAVGGELEIDPVAKTIYHHAHRGRDLKADNIIEFRRGLNIISMPVSESRGKLVNQLTGLGYGEGEYMLRAVAEAKGVNADGATSQDIYGVRRGQYTDKECKSLATMQAAIDRLVEESCWPDKAYKPRITDEAAALVEPGDTGHFVYRNINESLRILEITRSSDGGPATLSVARLSDPLVDQIVASGKQLATLQKSYQGVPSDSNMYFSEQFDRFSGLDKPATIPFFVPYGSDLLDLWLTYEVGGMRSFAAAVGGGGGATTPSGGGSTSGSGGGSTETSTSSGTPSGGGSTSGSSSVTTSAQAANTTLCRPTIMRSIATPSTYYELYCPALIMTVDNINVHIGNYSGQTCSYSWQVRTAAAGGGTLVASGTVPNLADQGQAVFGTGVSAYSNSNLYVRVSQTTAGACNYLFTAFRFGWDQHAHGISHTHDTPNHTHPDHAHNVNLPNHTHTTPAHTHTLPDHAHTLDFRIRESAAPASIRVYVDDALIPELNDISYMSHADILPWVRKDSNGRISEGKHTIEFRTSTNGQTGSVRGTLYTKKFLATEAA